MNTLQKRFGTQRLYQSVITDYTQAGRVQTYTISRRQIRSGQLR